MKVKICGIKDVETALGAVENGADAIGFVFAESKRKIDVETAKEIVKELPDFVMKIGVFVNETKEEIDKGVGFVLESILIDNVKKYYDLKNFSKKQENSIKVWLVDFFNELADILNKDFANFLSVRKVRWSVSPYAFAGYLYASSKLYGKNDWQNQLQAIISKIDFEDIPWKQGARNQEKLAIIKFEEVMSVVLG
jgi:hypothetical protein